MIYEVLKVIGIIIFLWGFMYFAGFIFCKTGHAKSIEEGIAVFLVTMAEEWKGIFRFLFKIFRPLFHFLYEAIYEGWTGQPLPEKLEHTERILSKAEVLELVQKFKNSPYIVPSLFNYIPNSLGVLWLDIKAVGLESRFQSLGRNGICDMAENIIQNFYMETRGTCVNIFIKVASPTRLYFAIPLSVEGEKYLEKQVQEQPQIQDCYEDVTFDLFEEEVPEDEENSDSWL
ncbi:putative uncharacterized protein [Lachnospiraceae bacterium CAG:364]|nr:putative uncharacterized protein [Lachnospiraceae bacterium CAG:364]